MRKQYLIPMMSAVVLIVGLLVSGTQVWADDTAQLKEQVKVLQNRVDQLESELVNRQQVMPPVVMGPAAMPVYDQWNDPLRQMMLMQAQIDRKMHQAFAGSGAFSPKMDMKQTDKEYLVTMDIPGMDKDKINVEIKEGVLIISGERQSENQDNKNTGNNQYFRQERSFGSFMQAIPLPADAQKDKIQAQYKDGVLTVSVARMKKEEKGIENAKIMVN